MERAQVKFDDVAVYFTEEEWRSLREEQKSLYKEVMNDNYQMILSLNRPDLITNIELGCEPYITTARDSTIQDSWQGERLAASDRSIFQESIDNTKSTEPIIPPKRQRRYPRVNPFRWIKKHKKSKSRSSRTSRRSEQRENGNIEESNCETPPVRGDVCTDEAGDSREGHSELCTEDPSNSVQTSPQTEDGNRTSKDSPGSRTIQIMGTKYKPDLRVTLSISEEESGSVADRGEGIADLEHYTLHTAEAERATSSSDTTPFPDQHNTDQRDEDGHTPSCKGAASSPLSLPETTDAGKSPHLNEERHQEKTRMDSACEGMALPRRKVKHVQFSDTVTTFIIESEEAEMAEREFFDSIRLQRKIRPRVVIVSKDIKSSTTAEPIMVTKSQDSKPKATQPERKTIAEREATQPERKTIAEREATQPERKTTAVRDTREGGSQDLKSPNFMKCNKTMKTTEEVEGSLPSAVCRRDTAEPSLSTGPPLQSKNRDERSMVTRSQDSKPNATQPERKTTTKRDTPEGGSQDLKSPNSIKCNKTMKTTEEVEGSLPSAVCRRDLAEPSPSTGPPLQPKNRDEGSMVTRSQDSKPKASQPKRKTTTERDSPEGGSQDLKSPNSVKCNKIMTTTEEVEGSLPSAVCREETAEPSPSTGPPLQPKNRDEESFTKSRDSKLSATQPERETTAVCDMLGGGSQDLKSQNSIKCNKMMKTMEEVEGSPPSAVCGSDTTEPSPSTEPQLQPNKKDVGTQIDLIHKEEMQQPAREIQLTPQHPADRDQNFMKSYSCSNCGKITHWTRLNDQQKADVEMSSLHMCRMCSRQRDKSAFSPDKGTPNTTPTKCATSSKNVTGSPARKRPHCLLLDDSPDTSSPAKKKQRQDVKGDAETPSSSTNPNGQLKKSEEASLSTSTSHNVQLKKVEEVSLRTSANQNVQLKKGEASPRTSTSHSVQLKKAEASPRTSTSLSAQLKKVDGASLRTSTSHNVQLKKGEEASPKTSANPNAQLKKGEASPRTSTSVNVQLKKGEEPSLRTSTSHSVQLKKGEKASPKPSTNRNVQLKKGEASPRTSTNHSGHLKKSEEASLRTSISHNVQLKKSEEESQRTKTNPNVQLNKGEEESLRTSTNHNSQLKNGKESLSKTSANHVQLKKNADNNKKCVAAQNAHTDNNFNLCSQCRHCESLEDAKLHHKVKTINKTATRSSSTKVLSNPDPKNDTPEKRKSNQILQNKPSPVQEQKLPSDSKSNKGTMTPQDPKNGAQTKKDACVKCGKLFLKRQKTKPLANIQKPVRGGSTISTDKIQKPDTKSDSVRKKRVKKSLGEPKVKKPRNAEGTKSPKSPRRARDKALCTKCGKRLALHVAPSEDGPSEGGNDENECVVLPRKKRKRRLAGMEPFTCSDCGKIFTRNFTLLQHRLIHTGERPYACKVCRKTFRDSSYLIVHMRSHTKEKPYTCTHCGKCFSQNSALHVHLRTHTDERPFQCLECGKNFTDRSTYRHHQRIHTGEKPYACSYCGKKFTQQPHMKRHETIHTGERPFGCELCGKRFIERTKLQKHERVHRKGKD